ncbi:hypothetical protein [Armatimonas sp.]|nr:hypothetical protein [Armatimonas sp.]
MPHEEAFAFHVYEPPHLSWALVALLAVDMLISMVDFALPLV